MTAAPRVWTFFYGSYINFEVLREVDLVPDKWEVARLAGFDIRIQPRANLVRSDAGAVYVLPLLEPGSAAVVAEPDDLVGRPAGVACDRLRRT